MKKFKMFLPIAAIALAVSTSAFKTDPVQKSSSFSQKWYDFTGTDPNNPMDYTVHLGPAPTCNSGSSRCAVKAEQNTGLPGDRPNLNDASIEIRNKP